MKSHFDALETANRLPHALHWALGVLVCVIGMALENPGGFAHFGMLTLAVRKRASDPPTILATVPLKTDQATTTAISSRLMLATIPGPTQWVDVVTSDAAKGAFRPNVGFLSSVGVTVVVQVADEAQQSKRWVDGLVWRASDGTLHSSAGSVVVLEKALAVAVAGLSLASLEGKEVRSL